LLALSETEASDKMGAVINQMVYYFERALSVALRFAE